MESRVDWRYTGMSFMVKYTNPSLWIPVWDPNGFITSTSSMYNSNVIVCKEVKIEFE